LLIQFQNLEGIYAHLDEVPEKWRKKLETHKEMAFLCRDIARLYRPSGTPAQIADPASPYWGLVRQAMYGMANAPNGTGYKFFHT
ncbi:hypothetical protein MJI95_38320, partial [Salmonella enterica subsp. enterica serovar Kentucky]|nr:hypothetical protein [Salmonella enterica subsp. enterica serovar Kentucky]